SIPDNITRSLNYIGKSAFSGDSPANAVFDEIRIWNVARTQAQIQQNMMKPLLGSESNLVLYYPMDEGTGTNLIDRTGNNPPGSLVGAPALPLWVASAAPMNFPPTLLNLPVSGTNGTFATANAAVTMNGSNTSLKLIYGPTTSYGFTNG